MTRPLICCLLAIGVANVLAFEEFRSPGSDMVKRPQNPYSWMNKYRVKKSHPVEEVEEAFDDGEVEKRARNPYAWTVTDNRFGKRGARNPYSWMNDAKPKRAYSLFADQRMPLNPYSWMSSMVKKSRQPYFFVDERSPIRNPYSWQN
ncbi:hypothetical protein QR680_006542 [Steinernema hermaphroditum]|uniref:Uncharacterized protein n=1 Tax=Steinernema hermaphroditum TaxID=289476 RepID=A0AA39HVW9_9BILA|nr:hypothetical protein QR680_006542 [Steinernema hermaphroditum]